MAERRNIAPTGANPSGAERGNYGSSDRRQSMQDQSRRRTMMIVGAIVIVAVAVVVLLIYVLSRRSALPDGTQTFAEPDHDHVAGAVQYDRIPPAGGAHNATWLNCGVYDQPVPNENADHSLEHGAVWVTYEPNLPQADVVTLRQTVEAHYRGAQRYVLLSPYAGLPSPVVVSAWGAQLLLPNAQDPRLAAFIDHFAGGGQGGEQGAPSTGGTGTPVG